MKKLVFVLGVMTLLSTSSFSYDRGDTVYTCHWNQDGFLWLGGRYHACEHMILEKIGSRYRIESLESCQGYYSGEKNLISSDSLFSSSAIKYSKWGNTCKSDYIAK